QPLMLPFPCGTCLPTRTCALHRVSATHRLPLSARRPNLSLSRSNSHFILPPSLSTHRVCTCYRGHLKCFITLLRSIRSHSSGVADVLSVPPFSRKYSGPTSRIRHCFIYYSTRKSRRFSKAANKACVPLCRRPLRRALQFRPTPRR